VLVHGMAIFVELIIKFSKYLASLVTFHLKESVMKDIKQHVDTNSGTMDPEATHKKLCAQIAVDV
jgi:hypothetical protein